MSFITKTFAVSGLSIAASADTIHKHISNLVGVKECHVSLSERTMTVVFEDTMTDEKQIIDEVRLCGYDAGIPEALTQILEMPEMKETNPYILPACMILSGLILSLLPIPNWISLFPYAIVLYLLKNTILRGLSQVFNVKSDDDAMNSLTSLACLVCGIVCLIRKENAVWFLFSGATIPLINAFGSHNDFRKKKDLEKLFDTGSTISDRASVYHDHKEDTRKLNSLRPSELIILRPGQTIPADGPVIKGNAVVDESALTGNANPVEKNVGTYLYAGTKILKGSLTMQAEQLGSTTTMMKIRRMAENTAADHRFASPFSSIGKFLSFYLILSALIIFVGWITVGKDLRFALMCALCVTTCGSVRSFSAVSSSAVIRSAAKAAKEHILFRTVDGLADLSSTDVYLIDQNSSVTERKLTVTDFVCAPEFSQARFEYIVYALLSRNKSAMAYAITTFLRSRKLSKLNANEYSSLSRNGRENFRSFGHCVMGSPEEMDEKGFDTSSWNAKIQECRNAGKRILLFAEEDKVIGLIAAERKLLDGAYESIRELQASGAEVILICDSNESEAEILNKALRPDKILIRPDTDDLRMMIREMHRKNKVVTYISDTENRTIEEETDLCVAIAAGTNIQQEHCDILLTRDCLKDVLQAGTYSSQVDAEIQSRQILLVLYHIASIVLFGFLIPLLTSFAVPCVFTAIGSQLCLYLTHKNRDIK